ncbi:PIN domain-containing protein [Thiohalocapsa halophila]|uniref:PIN domain-containing protein n=1 Tax=Thiohalocapsa halophila TaxID=69359 RepID=A0ABS1CNV3_9GAMM|nr:PIN domain-containing protein [Thiohalocapsa halophila]MBK1633524.1 PIN domain-containing protein [Thiohalocapsa halophila]
MANFTVIYDACVFYPAPLRDLLVRLAQTRRFRARWTAAIHAEWISSLYAKRPDIPPGKLEAVAEQINDAVPDCLVTGYEHIVDGLDLPDPDDRHVLAAAIRAGAAAIITLNLKDFPDTVLDEYEIFAIHPDDFILDLADLEPQVLARVAKAQRQALQRPPLDPEAFVDVLRRQELPGVADFLEARLDLI